MPQKDFLNLELQLIVMSAVTAGPYQLQNVF